MDINVDPFDKADLILRHLNGALKAGEEEELKQWLAEDAWNQQFYDSLKDQQELEKQLAFFKSLATDASWEKVAARTVGKKTALPEKEARVIAFRPGKALLKYAAAIALLLVACAGFFLLKHRGEEAPSQALTSAPLPASAQDPRADKARLTLEDGREVILEDLDNGLVLQQEGIKVIKQGGQLVYQVAGKPGDAVAFNTISTPVGGQYQVVLPDGSKVWLNAASSLRFPTAFPGPQRQVELTGEGYFEVAKKTNQPFIVQAEDTRVEVLGTHFNIKAYANEAGTQTTLLEGSVKVSRAQASLVLKPGQQARAQDNLQLALRQPDLEEVMAWKQGLFQFNKASLKFISLQLERWYGVDFEFSDAMAEKHFSGAISRNNNIAQVLHLLELSGEIKFEINGKKIKVSSSKTR